MGTCITTTATTDLTHFIKDYNGVSTASSEFTIKPSDTIVNPLDNSCISFPHITNIKEIPGGKVTIVTFDDKTTEKVVRDDYDEYDLTTALLFALAKKMYRKTLTWEGIEDKALYELHYRKDVMKMITKAIKKHNAEETEKKNKEKKELEKKEALLHQREKKAKYQQKRKERKRKEYIEDIITAINKSKIK